MITAIESEDRDFVCCNKCGKVSSRKDCIIKTKSIGCFIELMICPQCGSDDLIPMPLDIDRAEF